MIWNAKTWALIEENKCLGSSLDGTTSGYLDGIKIVTVEPMISYAKTGIGEI